ncbi:MAG: hypothetical protein FDZ75_01880 [Actinobacteria bacterium]|nr:MAG: hypothetical protein FDZ75_01880 [Actinomycetota bacterium]
MTVNRDNDCPEGAHLDGPPTLYECPTCLYIGHDVRYARGEQPCPACHTVSANWRKMPAERLRRFDERIRVHHKSGDSEVVVILVATFLETVLEDLLARMMQAQGAGTKVIALTLDTERSIGLRIGKLFPALAGESFEDVAAEVGYREFPRRWRDMRSARNAFIHGESFDNPRETLDHRTACEAMSLLDQAYELFILMNNRFVANGGTRRKAGR